MPNWYIYQNNQKYGPVTSETLQQLTNERKVTPKTIIEAENGHRYEAGQIQGLAFPVEILVVVAPPEPDNTTSFESAFSENKNSTGPVAGTDGILFHLKGVGGQLAVKKDSVVISRKGASGFLIHGFAGDKTIPVFNIQAVQYKAAGSLTNGYIQFTVMGGKESTGGLFAATTDENTIVFTSTQNGIAMKIKMYIEKCIIQRNQPQSVQTQASGADELLKFKQLLDAGIITQEEFNAKKKQILGI